MSGSYARRQTRCARRRHQFLEQLEFCWQTSVWIGAEHIMDAGEQNATKANGISGRWCRRLKPRQMLSTVSWTGNEPLNDLFSDADNWIVTAGADVGTMRVPINGDDVIINEVAGSLKSYSTRPSRARGLHSIALRVPSHFGSLTTR